ncbi:hypothetical protein [Acaryochloris sp. CCMEE 5410]
MGKSRTLGVLKTLLNGSGLIFKGSAPRFQRRRNFRMS